MRMINPRSGHFSLGPNSNDPWYKKLIFYVVMSAFMACIYVMEWAGDALSFIGDLLK